MDRRTQSRRETLDGAFDDLRHPSKATASSRRSALRGNRRCPAFAELSKPCATPAGLPPTREMLDGTRQLLRWRSVLMGIAVFLTLMPLSFRFDGRQLVWLFLGDAPPQLTALVALAALGAWVAFLSVRRKLQATGV
jgi:hypothetical protein